MKTESEQVFEAFCEQHGLRFRRIPVASKKSPDYRLSANGIDIIVEVKQLDESQDDKHRLERLSAGETIVDFEFTDDRVAEKIKRAANQLRPHSKNGLATVLCICDMRRLGGISPDNVKVAMYGTETVILEKRNRRVVAVRPISPGGKRQCTPTTNTSISAVAVLSCDQEQLRLRVYHNDYARVALSPQCLKDISVGQYRLNPERLPYEWQRLTVPPVSVVDAE